jgi:type I site-specific restriction-modification system R (restriction) subunit
MKHKQNLQSFLYYLLKFEFQTEDIQNAYDDNLVRYRDRIRQLFVPNVACVLSNGAEAKVGAYNAKFRFFKDWLRVVEDKDSPAPLSKKTI